MSDSTYPKSTCIFQFLCAYRCTRHKLLLGFAATCASFSLFNRKPRLCFFDLPTRFSTSNRLQQGRMRTLPHPKKAQRVAREQTNQTTTDGPSNLPNLHREAGQRTLHITLKACLEGTALPNNVLQTCRGGFGKPVVFICHRLPTIPL